MSLQFVDAAQQELLDAIAYYEEIRADLGTRFKDEVDRCILWVAAKPSGSTKRRRVIVTRSEQGATQRLAKRSVDLRPVARPKP